MASSWRSSTLRIAAAVLLLVAHILPAVHSDGCAKLRTAPGFEWKKVARKEWVTWRSSRIEDFPSTKCFVVEFTPYLRKALFSVRQSKSIVTTAVMYNGTFGRGRFRYTETDVWKKVKKNGKITKVHPETYLQFVGTDYSSWAVIHTCDSGVSSYFRLYLSKPTKHVPKKIDKKAKKAIADSGYEKKITWEDTACLDLYKPKRSGRTADEGLSKLELLSEIA